MFFWTRLQFDMKRLLPAHRWLGRTSAVAAVSFGEKHRAPFCSGLLSEGWPIFSLRREWHVRAGRGYPERKTAPIVISLTGGWLFLFYDRLLQQLSPFLLLMIGFLVLAAARALRSGQFLSWIAGGFMLIGLGLGLQSLMDNRQLALSAPLITVLYLAGAMSTAKGVSLRCGEGSRRSLVVWATAGVCIICASWFSYVQDNLVLRMILLNSALGVIYISQLPSYLRARSQLSYGDTLLSITMVLIGVFQFLRAAYVAVSSFLIADADAFVHNLTLSTQWKLMLAASSILSLWFGFVAMLCAVNDRLEAMQRERDLDPLTSLLNRRGFFDQALAQIKASPHLAWMVVAGDVDRFKQINDQWSHAIGDKILVRIAGVLLQDARPQDMVARFGGEEFILLLGCEKPEEATAIAELKRKQIENLMVPPVSLRVTISFGVAALSQEDDLELELDRALATADLRLYQAKSQGRNRVVATTLPNLLSPGRDSRRMVRAV